MGSADQRMGRSAALEAMRVAILVAICLAYAAAVEAVKKDVDSETASLGKKGSPGSEMPLAAGLHDWVENVTDVTAEYNASAKALLAAHRNRTKQMNALYNLGHVPDSSRRNGFMTRSSNATIPLVIPRVIPLEDAD